jgi:ribonuclease J
VIERTPTPVHLFCFRERNYPPSIEAVPDRQRLSQDGFIVALIPVNARNKLAGEPEIISRGFITANGPNDVLQAARQEIKKHYQQGKGVALDAVRDTLQDFFYRKTQSQPVILPSLIRV